jgi:hypothetical protein
LERDFGAYERFRKSLPREESPPKPSKTNPVWPAGAKQPIDLIQFLTDTLRRLGYVPAGRTAYEEEPFRWPKWGDSPRVAMVVYLGRKLGRDASELRSILIPHVAKFKSPPNTSEPSAEEFVDRMLKDADVALASNEAIR